MTDSFSYDVFLSHSSKDKAVVCTVAERLRADGVRVWFDEWEIKPGDSMSAKIEAGLEQSRILVDHAIIGPAGVFTIETKTISKPMRGKVKIQFDGEHIQINGQAMERNPVHQAKAQASWLKKILQ